MTYLMEKSKSKDLSIMDNTEEITEEKFFSVLLKAPLVNKYYQLPTGFDIETTSYLHNEEKHGVMYIWQMGFLVPNWNIMYVYGRTWDEWERFIMKLKRKMNISKYKLIIYVHNLSFEFHWMFSHCYLTKVFARKKRHPIYVESGNLIFKCSYFLSNYSLRNLAKEKGFTLKGDMDYSIKRLPCTPINKSDMNYALTDVKIVCEYIQDEIAKNGDIKNIPLTSTGYARRYCLNYIKDNENIISYQKWLQGILPLEPDLFTLLYQGYTGAFTHSNYKLTHITLEDVHCIDFTSSYPAVMCRKRFPMAFHKVNPTRFKLFEGKAKIMKITYNDLKATTNHSIISKHKCIIKDDIEFNTIIDNGRVRQAKSLTTVITDLDFEIYSKFYTYSSYQIETLYVAEYRYLPRNLIIAILKLYADKTSLKGVIGREEAYLRAKELINAIYGMSVTNPINDEIEFSYDFDEWVSIETDLEEGLAKYKNNRNLFTAYQWGVWVTAWARWELLNTLYEFGEDGIYCDTDSIKYLNNHDDIIQSVNDRILKENDAIIKYYKLDPNLYNPKTIKGEIKTLGLWDYEHNYKYFKTLGAKRYCFSYEDEYFNSVKEKLKTEYNFFTTVSGVSKELCKNYIIEKAIKEDKSPFDIFSYSDELEIPKDKSGKNCFSYQIGLFSEEETDYLGNTMTVSEYSYVYSEPIPYKFNASDDYLAFLGIDKTYTNMTGTFNENRLALKE